MKSLEMQMRFILFQATYVELIASSRPALTAMNSIELLIAAIMFITSSEYTIDLQYFLLLVREKSRKTY